jgi:hypothetical protein
MRHHELTEEPDMSQEYVSSPLWQNSCSLSVKKYRQKGHELEQTFNIMIPLTERLGCSPSDRSCAGVEKTGNRT